MQKHVPDLLVLFTGHPTPSEGLDGDGGPADCLVDLPHAVASPVSLDDHRCPALLQSFSSHRFPEDVAKTRQL